MPGPPRAVPAGDPKLEEKQRLHSAGDTGQPLPLSDGGIHVYAHQRGGQTTRAVPGSQEVCEVLEGHQVPLGCLFLMKGEREHRFTLEFQLNLGRPKDAPFSDQQFFPPAPYLP